MSRLENFWVKGVRSGYKTDIGNGSGKCIDDTLDIVFSQRNDGSELETVKVETYAENRQLKTVVKVKRLSAPGYCDTWETVYEIETER